MKHFPLIIFALCLSALSACNKDKPVDPPAKESLLKTVSQLNLPSPFYHFEYDQGGRVKNISYSSGQASYEVLYDNNDIREIKNTSPGKNDKIQYIYNPQGKVELIKVLNQANTVTRMAELTYGPDSRLSKMEWDVRIEGLGFAREQTLKFAYNASGNLTERRHEKHFIEERQQAAVYIDRYEQFDNMTNVNDFELLHFQDGPLVFLPGVRLQLNNPLTNIRSGDGLNYEINYSYVYSNKRPLQKNGDMLYTNGPNAGKQFKVGYTFTYY